MDVIESIKKLTSPYEGAEVEDIRPKATSEYSPIAVIHYRGFERKVYDWSPVGVIDSWLDRVCHKKRLNRHKNPSPFRNRNKTKKITGNSWRDKL